MIFDRHEIVFAEGAASESFHPGEMGMPTLDLASHDEIYSLFPDLAIIGPAAYGPAARRSLKAAETAILMRSDRLGPVPGFRHRQSVRRMSNRSIS